MPPTLRKKRRTEIAPATFNTADCVTYEAFRDSTYPTSLITENLLRQLNYESLQGLAECLSWIIKSAGCEAQFDLSEDMAAADIVALVDQIEASCLRSPSGCPATFPLQRAEYSKRLPPLLTEIISSLHAVGSEETLTQLSLIVAAISSIRLQSLRLSATTFAGIIVNAFESESSGHRSLVKALVARTGDIAVSIRKLAVSQIGNFKLDTVIRSLNDLHSSVRATALKSLMHSKSFASNVHLEGSTNSDALGLDRIEEMAVRDVDITCRRAALRLLASHQIYRESVAALMDDEDDFSRKLAAELCISKLASSSRLAQHLVIQAVQLGSSFKAVSACVFGLEKVKSQYNVDWPQEIITMLMADPAKELRRTRLADKQEHKEIAAYLSQEPNQVRILKLLGSFLQNKQSGTSTLIEKAASLIRKLQYSDTLLSHAIENTAYLPFEKMLSSSLPQKFFENYIELCKDLFNNRSERNVLEALASVIESLPTQIQQQLCNDLHDDLRIKLAALLGPRGVIHQDEESQLNVLVLQFIIISRFRDISDLSRLPIWHGINHGNKSLLQLVRVLGMKGDAQLAGNIVEKLSAHPEGKIDDLLRIFISAKLRSIDLEVPFPVDINEFQPSSESVWQAAVAANAI